MKVKIKAAEDPEVIITRSGSIHNLYRFLYKLAISMKGSFAAEHGIGRAKLSIAEEIHSSVERNLMKSIKASIDKSNQLNPDVLVSLE